MSQQVRVEDLLCKAAFVLNRLGHVEPSALGRRTVFRDTYVTLESYRNGGLHLHICYSDNGLPAIEMWHGGVLVHDGEHNDLYAYVGHVYASLMS